MKKESLYKKIIKRLLDVVLCVITIIVLAPVFAVTAIAIKISSPGPVLYYSDRITQGNKSFHFYKFRSMHVTSADKGLFIADEERLFAVGKVIRKLKIDELPQLFNVIKGDMSIVGPRPERIEHVKMYTEEIPEFKFRTKVKGGITGYAQVYGKYNTTAYDKLKLDLMYIENYNIVLDFKIMLMTIKTIFVKSSTEGFSETQEHKILQEQKESE